MLKKIVLIILIVSGVLAFIAFCVFQGEMTAKYWLICQPDGCKESILKGEELIRNFRIGAFVYGVFITTSVFLILKFEKKQQPPKEEE